ncbi:hypothetical protein EN836_15335 [Mesorhizobium sp. M1C.F.Ca.ET.193.01.1.1]|uniref:hypothetical protein n=1 Tax=unclassified Mesorhizobium TaxID=325217 RepID=UPI000FD61FAE|nr:MULTISPECIES: hypothetical protein [unclassified Mesorhizobium]TGS99275.1 hypothetical protein EN820_34980 [bacterium M00.F.Ca.ET.177.01.1.1]TGQ53158.1 hypothetical protein EN853_15330 [Mesorhizobium sp. M1C.F.Ca.ET.210.01.1.1]TGQ70427.1 hypothetical protein EN855_015340 [Mesorhizobium sp. M1C.F.Ca.ET.212.01.1.1]TGR07183.1 hypothetical protein EN847_16250 [Mesorhizobium sp. M1C.F.Ca.ET.204.01.1.1]TGR27754.1 hypothetical protein EN839_16250 [Mesorhizobium sp. M1C.F.Ca.ET.196.01.1.1]
MRTLTMMLALSTFALAQPVSAQHADPQPPQALPPVEQPLPDQPPPDPGNSGQNVTNVVVVAIEDLPAEIKAQAEAVVTRTTAKDLARLQNSVDASPEAVSVLRANGLNSSQVVAANIDGDGTLTLIIQTTT